MKKYKKWDMEMLYISKTLYIYNSVSVKEFEELKEDLKKKGIKLNDIIITERKYYGKY